MPQDIILEFGFPVKGISDGWPRVEQPAQTTPACLNVLAYDRLGRARGAQRPGLTRLWNVPIGPTQPIYKQCKACSTGGLSLIWVPKIEIGGYPYYFKFGGDGLCYRVDSDAPETNTPNGPIASLRTTVASCADASCPGGTNPPGYRQARNCGDNSLAFVAFKEADRLTDPYFFKFNGKCYKVGTTEPLLPFTTMAIAVNYVQLTGCADALCLCAGCTAFNGYFTGTRHEHNQGGSVAFTLYTPIFTVCTEGWSKFTLGASTADDLTLLLQGSTNVTEAYSGVPGSPVTLTIPPEAILFRNTSGSMIAGPTISGTAATCMKTFIQGAHTHVLAAGAVGNDGSHHVDDFEADGFETREFTAGFTKQELIDRNWIDPDGLFRFKFAHIVCGAGYLKILAPGLECGNVNAQATLWTTGENITRLNLLTLTIKLENTQPITGIGSLDGTFTLVAQQPAPDEWATYTINILGATLTISYDPALPEWHGFYARLDGNGNAYEMNIAQSGKDDAWWPQASAAAFWGLTTNQGPTSASMTVDQAVSVDRCDTDNKWSVVGGVAAKLGHFAGTIYRNNLSPPDVTRPYNRKADASGAGQRHWIGTACNLPRTGGSKTFRTIIQIGADLTLSTLLISGRMSACGTVSEVKVNGNNTGLVTTDELFWTDFDLPNTNFVHGDNTIDFVVADNTSLANQALMVEWLSVTGGT